MILTGKAKVEFEKFLHDYLIDNDLQIDREFFPTSLWNTIMIEFFDSVGIEIYICPIGGNIGYQIKSENRDIKSKESSRQEATTEALKKANEIYNNKKGID